MKNKLLCLFILVSCQGKKLQLTLPTLNTSWKAHRTWISPYVILTKMKDIFSPINIITYNNLFVNNANVTVWKFLNGDSIGINLEELPAQADTIRIYTDLNYFNNVGNYDFGQVGETYFLKIK